MKTILLLLVFLLSIIQNAQAQYYHYQYFDGADTSDYNSIKIRLDTTSTNIWQVGRPNKSFFDGAATVPNVIVTDTSNSYPINNTSSFIAKVKPFLNFGIFAVQWMQKIDLDKKKDGAIIEYSPDGGNTWKNVFNDPYVYNFYGFETQNQDTLTTGEFAFSGTDSTWRDIWLCFDYSWLNSIQADTVLFKFTLKTDSTDTHKNGWMIDNMMARNTILHTVATKQQKEYVKVFPNPAHERLHIETQKIQAFHIIEEMVLLDAMGQAVERWQNIPTKFFIDTRKYANGFYQLKVKTNIKTETMPVVISHQ